MLYSRGRLVRARNLPEINVPIEQWAADNRYEEVSRFPTSGEKPQVTIYELIGEEQNADDDDVGFNFLVVLETNHRTWPTFVNDLLEMTEIVGRFGLIVPDSTKSKLTVTR